MLFDAATLIPVPQQAEFICEQLGTHSPVLAIFVKQIDTSLRQGVRLA
jgi:hypothetical protein